MRHTQNEQFFVNLSVNKLAIHTQSNIRVVVNLYGEIRKANNFKRFMAGIFQHNYRNYRKKILIEHSYRK